MFQKNYFLFKIVIIELVCFQLTSFLNINTDNAADSSLSIRLPDTIVPTNYNLKITTEIHKDIYEYRGQVNIILHVQKNTSEIILHAKELRGFQVNLIKYQPIYKLYKNLTFLIVNENSFLKIFSPVELEADQTYHLKIHFIGDIRNGTVGFYKTSYESAESNV